MNFKALALGSLITLGSIFGGVQSAQAGTCWFENYRTGTLAPTYCQTNIRTNANGHRVVDVVDHEGNDVTLVFWYNRSGDRHGNVEVIMNGGVYNGTWYTDNQGDHRISGPGGTEMAIRF